MERDRFVRFLSRKDILQYARKLGGFFLSNVGDLAQIAETSSPDGYEPFLVLAIQLNHPHKLCLIERQTSAAIRMSRGTAIKEKREKDVRQVYLVKNLRNGFVKIGFSKTPLMREATLQAEEPEVKLIGYNRGNVELERSLHEKYSHKRVRGEWFALSEHEVSEALEIINGTAL